ncbi:MAG: hypothetical protein M1838_004562 [Thelocarpon superellum]|nr:MAG: hypothetical protein M1838_004562 [Thelocarpon superellum]
MIEADYDACLKEVTFRSQPLRCVEVWRFENPALFTVHDEVLGNIEQVDRWLNRVRISLALGPSGALVIDHAHGSARMFTMAEPTPERRCGIGGDGLRTSLPFDEGQFSRIVQAFALPRHFLVTLVRRDAGFGVFHQPDGSTAFVVPTEASVFGRAWHFVAVVTDPTRRLTCAVVVSLQGQMDVFDVLVDRLRRSPVYTIYPLFLPTMVTEIAIDALLQGRTTCQERLLPLEDSAGVDDLGDSYRVIPSRRWPDYAAMTKGLNGICVLAASVQGGLKRSLHTLSAIWQSIDDLERSVLPAVGNTSATPAFAPTHGSDPDPTATATPAPARAPPPPPPPTATATAPTPPSTLAPLPPMMARMLQEHLSYLSTKCRNCLVRVESYDKRSGIALQAVSNLMMQKDNAINIEVAKDSKSIASASKRDGTAMKTIAIVTILFLPGTYISTLFAMPLFDWDAGPGEPVATARFWIYWAVTGPLTIVTLIIWLLWLRREVARNRQEDEDARESGNLEPGRRRGSLLPPTRSPRRSRRRRPRKAFRFAIMRLGTGILSKITGVDVRVGRRVVIDEERAPRGRYYDSSSSDDDRDSADYRASSPPRDYSPPRRQTPRPSRRRQYSGGVTEDSGREGFDYETPVDRPSEFKRPSTLRAGSSLYGSVAEEDERYQKRDRANRRARRRRRGSTDSSSSASPERYTTIAIPEPTLTRAGLIPRAVETPNPGTHVSVVPGVARGGTAAAAAAVLGGIAVQRSPMRARPRERDRAREREPTIEEIH